MVYFTRKRFAPAIIDAETLRSLSVNISRIFVSAVTLRSYSFHKCVQAEPDPRDFKGAHLGLYITHFHFPPDDRHLWFCSKFKFIQKYGNWKNLMQ